MSYLINYFHFRTKWKRMNGEGIELLASTGNIAAVRHILQNNPNWLNNYGNLYSQQILSHIVGGQYYRPVPIHQPLIPYAVPSTMVHLPTQPLPTISSDYHIRHPVVINNEFSAFQPRS